MSVLSVTTRTGFQYPYVPFVFCAYVLISVSLTKISETNVGEEISLLLDDLTSFECIPMSRVAKYDECFYL